MRVRLVFFIVFCIGSLVSMGFACEPASTGDVCVNINSLETFASIQGAIDDADTLDGHMLIVVNSTCIHETVTVNKAVHIWGEPINQKPVVDGRGAGSVFTITADGVIIEGLVIENNCSAGGNLHPGIMVQSNDNIIRCNEFRYCFKGVYLYFNTSGNTVHNNEIHSLCGDSYGIMLAHSDNNTIYSNTITGNGTQGTGIFLSTASYNTIIANDISDFNYGILLYLGANYNKIHHNNFLSNTNNAYIENQLTPCVGNAWDNGASSGGNYWSDYSGSGCYTIPGGYADQDCYPLPAQFQPVCGNVDGSPDHVIDIGDITYLNNYLANGGPIPIPPCMADVDGDGDIDTDDSQYLIDYIYNQGPAPACRANCCNEE
jgi:parallel beta-helix repeat protein